MQKRKAIVLDFGSSNLSLCIGSRGINNTFAINCLTQTEYDGFSDGEFFDKNKLKEAVKESLKTGETDKKHKIKSIYVGVPSEFCTVTSEKLTQHFSKKTKITNEVITELANELVDREYLKSKILISCNANYVVLDDDREIIDFENKKARKITAEISLIYIDNYFVSVVNEILADLGLESVTYICSADAQAKYLFKNEDKLSDKIVVDVGHITTSVFQTFGNGLRGLVAFSIGGGHVSADLAECLNLTFEQGEALKREIVLSINSKRKDECYEVNVKDKILPVSINFANEVVKARLDMICQLIKKIINDFHIENSQIAPVYLTGGGLSYIIGGRDYLAKSIGKNVQLLACHAPINQKPHLTSVFSLLNEALSRQEKSRKLHNIFKKRGWICIQIITLAQWQT